MTQKPPESKSIGIEDLVDQIVALQAQEEPPSSNADLAGTTRIEVTRTLRGLEHGDLRDLIRRVADTEK